MRWAVLFLTFAVGGCAGCLRQPASTGSTPVAAPGPPTPAAKPPAASPPDTRRIRRAQVAGSFYPDDPERLAGVLDGLAREARPPKLREPVIALISPHAGYRYSGKAAAAGFELLRGRDIRRVVVLAVAHRFPLRGASIPDVTHFETPLGLIPIDAKAVAQLRRCPLVSAVAPAEEGEHSLEVQLPLLQRVLPQAVLVPILVGRLSEQDHVSLAAALAGIVDRHTVVVASSDFTHRGQGYGYEVPAGKGSVEERLARVDQGSIDQIMKLDRRGLLHHVEKTGSTICGIGPIAVLLGLLAPQPGIKAHLISRATSADVTSDWSSSVTYIDMAFTGKWTEESRRDPVRGEPGFSLADEDKRTLVRLARASLEAAVRKGRFSPDALRAIPRTPSLERKAGAFVTLRCQAGPDAVCVGRGKDLRGCIGTIEPSSAVYDVVAQRAASAALEDSRFPHRVSPEELRFVSIEISVLTPPRPVAGPEEIVIGRHGIILGSGWNRATFLPQVAPEQGWDRETTLAHLARKAGLPADAWKNAEYQVYEAIIIEEEHEK